MKNTDAHTYIQQRTQALVPSMRYDGQEEYRCWQQRARAKLNELLGLPLERCADLFEISAETDCGNYVQTDFTFQSEPGYVVPGAFLAPKGIMEPRPVVICIQGHSTGMHISLGEEKFPGDDALIAGGRDFAIRALAEGYCAVVLEPRYMGQCGQNEAGAPLCSTKNAALPALLLGRTAIGERVWDVQRLLDVMEKYFTAWADMTRVVCMGNSGGGTVTFYAACTDDRIALAMPSCAVCEFENSIVPLHHCCCNYIPGIRRYFEMGDLAGLMALRKLVVVCGVLDPDFPIAGTEKSFARARSMFSNLGRSDHCHLVKGPAGHQFYPDLAWPVANRLMELDG